jgi:hypothetical protein
MEKTSSKISIYDQSNGDCRKGQFPFLNCRTPWTAAVDLLWVMTGDSPLGGENALSERTSRQSEL